MPRHRHEERVYGIFERLLGEAALQGERALPRASRFVDLVLTLARGADGLRPLVPLLCARSVAVEHFHRSPTVTDWARSVAKLAHLTDEWWHGLAPDARKAALRSSRAWAAVSRSWEEASSRGEELPLASHLEDSTHSSMPATPRPPILLLLTARPLQRSLATHIELPQGPVSGVRFAERALLGDLLVVHLRGLPQGRPGYSVLRLMPTPRPDEDVLTGIRELLADPGVLPSTKEALMADLGSNTIPSTPVERRTILDVVREEARAEVEAKLAAEVEAKLAAEVEARKRAEARVTELEALVRSLRAKDAPQAG